MKSSSIGVAVSASILILITANCSSSNSSKGTTAGGGDGGSSGCATPTLSTGDGSSACGSITCSPAQYCYDSFAGTCQNGCTATDNCAQGDYCDLSNPTTDAMGKSVGTCRQPPTCTTTPQDSGSSAACPDVHGVYSVTLDTSGSSQACTNAFSNSTCTITETSCALAWSCNPNNGFTSSTVDSSGDSTVTIPAPSGGNATCAIVFGSGSFTFDCQFTAQGTAVDCKGNATEN
jgi:hypothetical protein